MARTWRGNTPIVSQVAGSAAAILLSVANSSRSSAGLFTFVILLGTAAVLVLYLAGALSAWRLVTSRVGRAGLLIAFLFILFAFFGAGLEPDAWCLVLLAIGVAVRFVLQRLGNRALGRQALVASAE